MCGIVGAISRSEPVSAGLFERQVESLIHRGPDDSGIWFDETSRVALGNRRLAVRDLSPTGHMPMIDLNGKICITFNGEIYNFRELRKSLQEEGYHFNGASDTEVVLVSYVRWGINCLDFLRGMFALAIYDNRPDQEHGGRLFIARDRAGEKPLFYRHHQGGFCFASELKALFENPGLARKLDPHSLNFYLAFGYVPFDRCIIQNVKKLPPGHAATYDRNSHELKIWKYWSLPEEASAETIETGDYVSELEHLLQESVRLRLVADVPVGIFLSGGLDSSLVTALCARCSSVPVKTFTVVFPGFGTYNEGPYAKSISDHFSTEHTELEAHEVSYRSLEDLVRFFDEPLADSSLLPTFLISSLTRQHVTVALGGDGGDELFGGYLHYSQFLKNSTIQNCVPHILLSAIGGGARNYLPCGLKGRHFLSGLAYSGGTNFIHNSLIFDEAGRKKLLSPVILEEIEQNLSEPEAFKYGLWSTGGNSPVSRMTRLDFQSYLVDDILVKVDRATMASSLEVRSPFLDENIIDFCFGRVPDTLKASAGERKKLLRLLGRKILPADFNLNRKQGFSLPLARWFAGAWGDSLCTVLQDTDGSIFNKSFIHQLLAGQRRGFSNITRIFSLAFFELWRRYYNIVI